MLGDVVFLEPAVHSTAELWNEFVDLVRGGVGMENREGEPERCTGF